MTNGTQSNTFELVEPVGNIVLYDRMRLAVQKCVSIDDAKKIKDQAEALKHYAKQRHDPELQKWMSQIRLRAIAQIGKISRELEKAKPKDADPKLVPAGGKHLDKAEQLADAGLSTTTAHRYEELAAPNAQLAPAFDSAFENYFATAEAEGKEPTFRGVAGALRKTMREAGVLPPKRKPRAKAPEPDVTWVDFSIGLTKLGAEKDWNWDLICERLCIVDKEVERSNRALVAIQTFLTKLQETYPHEYRDAITKSTSAQSTQEANNLVA